MKVVLAPDNRLRVKTKLVKKISTLHRQIIKDMIKLTISYKDPEGVGLASTQIGKDEQYFIMKEDDNTFTAVFNPRILSYSKKTKKFFEGCLSIPHYWGEVTRPIAVTVSFTSINGETIKKRLTGFAAWVFQHEYDHLQGKIVMDLVLEQNARLFKEIGKDITGGDVFEEVSL